MPSPESDGRHQQCVLWKFAGSYSNNGSPKVQDPIEITVRWTDTYSEITDQQGNTVIVDASVVTDRDIPVHSLLWEGTLADWQGTGSGMEPNDLMRVVSSRKVPDVKGREFKRTLKLSRYQDALPDIV